MAPQHGCRTKQAGVRLWSVVVCCRRLRCVMRADYRLITAAAICCGTTIQATTER